MRFCMCVPTFVFAFGMPTCEFCGLFNKFLIEDKKKHDTKFNSNADRLSLLSRLETITVEKQTRNPSVLKFGDGSLEAIRLADPSCASATRSSENEKSIRLHNVTAEALAEHAFCTERFRVRQQRLLR